MDKATHSIRRPAGEHDEQCEYDEDGFYLCHCSKRRREAEGFTDPPTEPLEFPPPSCPRCDGDLVFDDSWCCYACSLSWPSNGLGPAEFTDDYGPHMDPCAEHGRRLCWRCREDAPC